MRPIDREVSEQFSVGKAEGEKQNYNYDEGLT